MFLCPLGSGQARCESPCSRPADVPRTRPLVGRCLGSARLFRVLWLFWFLRDHLGEASSWVDQLLPNADSFGPEAQSTAYPSRCGRVLGRPGRLNGV